MTDNKNNVTRSIPELLKHYQTDPILPLELSELLPKLRKNNASVEHFKGFYRRDPLLCAYLVDLSWQATKKRDNHPFDAEHAMSTIGINGAKKFLNDIPEGEKTLISDEVKFILSSSLLAGELAKNISAQSSFASKSNVLYWGAIAHQFPDTLLWHLNLKGMWRVQYHQTKHCLNIAKVESKHLGFTRADWRQVVAKQWHMAELNQSTFLKNPPNNPKDLIQYSENGYDKQLASLKEWHNTDSWLILTANWLAKSLMAPWLINRSHHYFKIIQKAYSINDKKLKTAISESVRKASENIYDSRLFVPASCHLYLPQTPIYPAWLNERVGIKKLKSKHTTQENEITFDIKALLQKLINTPEKFKNSAELITQSFNAITKGVGFSRVSFMTVNWHNKKVICKMSFCKANENLVKIKPEFEFIKPTPLQNFLTSQGFLIFDIKKHQKIWSKLPVAIRQQRVPQFAFYSIKQGEKVKALVYVDGKESLFSDPNKIKQLKIILNAMNKALSGNTNTQKNSIKKAS
ncbi:MAG: hypothetical protein COA86_18360 [Kangiella sp.]|nr:MAG: hypothetical protein COA86_18360 [Kangiella sp.]